MSATFMLAAARAVISAGMPGVAVSAVWASLRIFSEIIIATGATIDGQNTAHYIADFLQEFNIKITRLGYGIPIGSEIDYLDEGTISVALKTRSKF